MNELTFKVAIEIIERELLTIRNPRILEKILEILGYGNKVKDRRSDERIYL